MNLAVEVEKEDEAIPLAGVKDKARELGDKKDAKWQKAILEDGVSAAIDSNRGIEGIPVSAAGSSEISKSNLASANTKWNEGVANAPKKVYDRMAGTAKKAPNANRPEKDPLAIETTKKGEFRKERKEALDQERRNYRPERYDVSHDLPGDEDLMGELDSDPVGLEAVVTYLQQSGKDSYKPSDRKK